MSSIPEQRVRVDHTAQHDLRVEVDMLTGLVNELDPATLSVLDMRAMLLRRRQSLLDRLAAVNPTPPNRRPVVLDPSKLNGHMSRQGQPLTPVITSEVAPTLGLSSAQVWMPPHHTSFAHVHRHTGVSVLVMQGSAITLWWDENGDLHELPQGPGQHLYIPHGVPHAAINPHNVPVVAAEFRSNPVFNADNELLPDLDPTVAARMTTVLAAA
ncbi:MAG TPA: cupin domain-containing protein [Pseudonocardiaceae bacterium]